MLHKTIGLILIALALTGCAGIKAWADEVNQKEAERIDAARQAKLNRLVAESKTKCLDLHSAAVGGAESYCNSHGNSQVKPENIYRTTTYVGKFYSSSMTTLNGATVGRSEVYNTNTVPLPNARRQADYWQRQKSRR